MIHDITRFVAAIAENIVFVKVTKEEFNAVIETEEVSRSISTRPLVEISTIRDRRNQVIAETRQWLKCGEFYEARQDKEYYLVKTIPEE